MSDVALPPVRGTVDGEGRLITAEPRLAELNARAGGAVGGALAIPQLATLARLARRLGVLISRAVTVADGEDDIELWVRAEPEDGGARLTLTGWRYRAGRQPEVGEGAAYATTSGDWTWETDAALRITHLSPALAVRAGREPDTLLGKSVTQLFDLTQDADGGFPLLAAVAEQRGFADQRAGVRGSNAPYLLDAEPRVDAAGRFAGFTGSARIADEPGELEATPTPARPDLTAAFGVQIDRALRTPLGKIVANADSIHAQADGPLKGEYAEYASDIATAGRHLMGLVDDLVDLQFVEREGFTAAAEDIDLADIARRASGLLAVRAEGRQVRIDRPAAADTLPATGEFRRALQIMVNLVANAVRYSPDGGMVWIRLERDGPIAAVIVADQGKGIATEDQGRIFEKFERVDPSEPGGSGLGLYIARKLARAMGGDIVVDSAPGQGARFVLTLPAR